jgi:SAM-dependent methyltransferase
MNQFNKDYISYWKDRVNNSIDGSKVADLDIIDHYIKYLKILRDEKVLDLGCGHGRLYPIIQKYSYNVFGVDVTYDVLNEASKFPYSFLLKGSAEDTNIVGKWFDKIISWGVFDVVQQEQSLREVNRILKTGGLFLFTGKNVSYDMDDTKAFIAERNAKLKDFPNHFTDVSLLIKDSLKFGFEVVAAFAFKYRGDLGENRFIQLDLKKIGFDFYEFILILKKVEDISTNEIQICFEYSNTAKAKAKENNFSNVIDFFMWNKKVNNE